MPELQFKEFEKLLAQAKNYQLDVKEKNLFDTALRKHYENPTTELLAFFLNPKEAHGLNTLFFESMLHSISITTQLTREVLGDFISVETEKTTSDNKRIDLIIETTNFLIIVECKIYHIHNNPIDSYEDYACERVKYSSKEVIYLVLCINGISEYNNPIWKGIGYDQLIDSYKLYISKCQPKHSNKWFILAQEFISHLENYYSKPMNIDNFEFLKAHSSEINKLLSLSNQVFSQLNEYILKELKIKFGKNFELRNYKLPTFFDKNPEYWFCNINLNTDRWICPTLEIDTTNNNLPSKIHLCIERTTNEDHQFIEKFLKVFPTFKKQSTPWMYAGKIKYDRFTLNFETLEIDVITAIIIDINKLILNFYENSHATTN